MNDTIAAISTTLGVGAISIIRVSGSDSILAVNKLFKGKDLEKFLQREGLKLKENWQLFKVDSRPIDFLGYRFYRGYTTLRSNNFLRIKRRVKKVYKKGKLNKKDASAIISYHGWIKHSNSFEFNKKYIRPYTDIKKCKEVVSNANRKQCKTIRKI